jgi:hypothetical protein
MPFRNAKASAGVAFVCVYLGLAAIGTGLGYFELVPDPLTYWMWVGAIIFLAALGFAALKALHWIK